MAVSEKTALEEDWILQRETAVAWLRVAFAVVAVLVIQLNPARVARFPSLSIVMFDRFSYTASLSSISSKTRGTTRVGAITTTLDVVWIAVIVFSTGGTRTPFFFYYSFPVITASLRWGLKGSLPVASLASCSTASSDLP